MDLRVQIRSISLFVLIIIWVGFTPIMVRADPIVLCYFNTVPAIPLDSNVAMPWADVNISITPKYKQTTNYIHNVTLSGLFYFESNETKNIPIAFAFPSSWRENAGGTNVDDCEFDILFNGEHMDYWMVESEDLVIPDSLYELSWIEIITSSYSFAVFDTPLFANEIGVLQVLTSFSMIVHGDYFYFNYCVGTAKSWDYYTLETVRITITNTIPIGEHNFTPIDSLTVIDNFPSITGKWDLNMSEFEENDVGFQCEQYNYDRQTVVVTVGAIAIIVPVFLVSIYVIKSKRN